MGRIYKGERSAPLILKTVSVLAPQSASTFCLQEAAVGHRRLRNLATSAFAASCAAVASLNFLISAGLVLARPIGSADLFKANALRSAAMAL
jgi:hypothetical protein